MIATITEKSIPLFKTFNERQKRLWAASETLLLGRGGHTAVSCATGLSPAARRGIKALQETEALEDNQIRNPGGGKYHITKTNPTLEHDLD